jgi:lysine 6-dehydrogenase
MKISVLGAGLIGSAIAVDLAQDVNLDVFSVDLNHQMLDMVTAKAPITGVHANLSELDNYSSLLVDSDLVVLAVPGFMGFESLKKVIEAGKNVVDISFFPEDPFLLDELAKEKGVTAVVDCGVAPGLSNVIAGYVETQLDRVESYICYVGGLPLVREWPYEYKAVFSPIDVLEEYTRPARYVEYGREVVRPALTDIELLDFPGVGTLEAFNTDGLRSLAVTLDAPFMKEKTLRYPGHANLMRVFRDSGFFSEETVEVSGESVTPINLTSKLLFDQWKLGEGESDITVFEVTMAGEIDGVSKQFSYTMLDTYDQATDTTSMARTTGYTCSIVTRQVHGGLFTQKGICPPEYVGRTPGCWQHLLAGYAARNIELVETLTENR